MALTKYNYNSFDVTPVASKALAFNSDADGFTTASEGSMVLIKELTASSDSTLSFVDGASDVVLDNTYPIYLFKFINIHPSSTSRIKFQFNGSDDDSSHSYDVTKTTSVFRAYQYEGDTGASLDYTDGNDIAQGTGFQEFYNSANYDNDANGCGELWLFNPSSTTYVKHFMSNFSSDGRSSGGNIYELNEYVAGYFNTTADITAMQFKFESGNIDAGTIKLYGIKDS